MSTRTPRMTAGLSDSEFARLSALRLSSNTESPEGKAELAAVALDAYVARVGGAQEEMSTAIKDLLNDLMHWIDCTPVAFPDFEGEDDNDGESILFGLLSSAAWSYKEELAEWKAAGR